MITPKRQKKWVFPPQTDFFLFWTNKVSKIIIQETLTVSKTLRIDSETSQVPPRSLEMQNLMKEAQEKYISAVQNMVDANQLYLQRLEEWREYERTEREQGELWEQFQSDYDDIGVFGITKRDILWILGNIGF